MRTAAAFACALLLAACAGPAAVRGTLRYGSEGGEGLWPPPPEPARFRFAGTLTGEPNFRAAGAEVDRLKAFGRWLVGLDGSGEAPVVLQRPSAVAGDDDGRLFVSDASRQAVFVFDEKGGQLLVWDRATESAGFVSPAGLAVGGGRLYVADAGQGAVFVLGPDGAPQGVLGRGQLQRPTGLAFDAAGGRLFVADTYAHDIKVFAPDGRLLQTLGRRGSGAGEFNYPTHLALAGGELYVTDTMNQRVQVLDAASGRPLRSLGARGLAVGNLVRPKGVAVDAQGHVYVIESYHDHLLVYSREGEFLLPIGGTGSTGGRFYLPAGVWVDAKQRVFVADMFNGRVVAFQFLGGG